MFNSQLKSAALALVLATPLALPLVGCSESIPVQHPNLPPPTGEEAKSFADASNAFGLDLYQQVSAGHDNLVFSPASITMALAMTYGGAKGDTAAQMKSVLHFGGSPDGVAASAGKLASSLQDPSAPITFRIANELFGEKSVSLEKPFLDGTKASFGAPLVQLDFKSDADGARSKINDWVSDTTNKRIVDLLPSGSINPATRLVLVNAIYFLGDWNMPFEKEATGNDPFTTGAGATSPVPTMHADESSFAYGEKDDTKVLSMPYKGGGMSMVFLLPNATNGLPALEKSLTGDKLVELTSALQPPAPVRVALPKFEVAPKESIALGTTLAKMGMPLAFDDKKADFTGIYNPSDADERIHISDVFHKAFVKVDEKGTEAAAATAVVMKATAAIMVPPERSFIADHPFLFLIRDDKSGMILFMGRVEDPAS